MSKSPPKPLRVAEFKAHLSEYLRAVRAGRTLLVYDRDTPVARVMPVSAGQPDLPSRKPTTRISDLKLPKPLGRDINVLGALRDERRERF